MSEIESDSNTLFEWRWSEVQQVYVIILWLLIASFAKILFHVSKKLTKVFPDSSLLIIVGLLVGWLLHEIHVTGVKLDSHVFFLYLLPPIIFDAGYFMPNRALFKNLDSVLLFSIVGTLWNTFSIGISLLIMSKYQLFSLDFSTFEIFIFSSLISAVDPVAVIAIFEEIHVNEFLFINVFGEALFNDGVTVVLYQAFLQFSLIGDLKPIDYVTGGLSLFTVAFGGVILGVTFAIFSSLATRYTPEGKILSPVFIFLLPYMAYLSAEMISVSSIIAIAICGMVMKQYVKGNITSGAASSVKYFTKMLAQSSETVIFMFLGISTVATESEHHIDWIFITSTIVFCLVYRAIGVIVQCWLLSRLRGKKFKFVDQFILSYGGLRGAIAYGLVVSIPGSIVAKPMFTTATIAVIYFTVFLQGTTIRPLVNYLKVKRKDNREPTMTESVYLKYLDYMMSGVEDIAGMKGHYTFIENFERFNAKVIKPILMKNEKKASFDASSIVRAYEKITLEDAMKLAKSNNIIQNKRIQKIKSASRIGAASESTPSSIPLPSKVKQFEKYLESGENIESLYAMFSTLLDRKVNELYLAETRDDIKDDYMAQVGSRQNLASIESIPQASNSQPSNIDRRLSTGDLDNVKMKKSTDFRV